MGDGCDFSRWQEAAKRDERSESGAEDGSPLIDDMARAIKAYLNSEDHNLLISQYRLIGCLNRYERGER